mgnify:CR=1 FL=1
MLHSALEIIDVLAVNEYDDGSYIEIRLMSNGSVTSSATQLLARSVFGTAELSDLDPPF